MGKNRLPPTSKATIPPFKTPRQLKMKQTGKASVVQEVVDVTETEHKDSDSEDETQFGVVWEKFVPEVVKQKSYPHDVFIPETEAQDETQEAQPHVIPFIKGIQLMSEGRLTNVQDMVRFYVGVQTVMICYSRQVKT